MQLLPQQLAAPAKSRNGFKAIPDSLRRYSQEPRSDDPTRSITPASCNDFRRFDKVAGGISGMLTRKSLKCRAPSNKSRIRSSVHRSVKISAALAIGQYEP